MKARPASPDPVAPTSARAVNPPRFQPRLLHPRYWPTWLGVGILWGATRLPWGGRERVGRGLGRLLFHLARRRRRIADINLRLCFPELSGDERRALLRRTFEANAIGLLDTAWCWWCHRDDLLPLADIRGLPAVQDALREGRGVLLIGAHYTSLDIAGQFLALYLDFDVIYRHAKNPVMDYLIRRGRHGVFGHVIERSDTRRILRSLKEGRAVWYAPDQDYGPKHSVFAPFFGVPAATITATGRLARVNDSPVFFMNYFRKEDTPGYLMEFFPMPGFPSGDDVADATEVNRRLETQLRRFPDQYMWVHRRFKTRPPGEPRLY